MEHLWTNDDLGGGEDIEGFPLLQGLFTWKVIITHSIYRLGSHPDSCENFTVALRSASKLPDMACNQRESIGPDFGAGGHLPLDWTVGKICVQCHGRICLRRGDG